jgi:hypothetical protein
MPIFYYTAHPRDACRARLPLGCSVMLVASAHWDDDRKRFRVRRPPADHIAGLCVDCGGFTAARRWGRYPWTPAQYADFVQAVSRDVPLAFVACMDYACERGVNREAYATNIARIDATIANEVACREAAPSLPWLPVLQGDTLEERAYDLDQRRALGMLPADYAGIGSVCGRGAVAARNVVKFYAGQLFGVKYHAFGMHVGALDDSVVPGALRSWDSYSWTWARGARSLRAPEYLKQAGESYSAYARRLAGLYHDNTIAPRLARPVQHTL